MAWRVPDIDDIYATLTKDEVEIYRTSANWTEDPIKRLLTRSVSVARGYLKANGRVKMSPDAEALPESCISPAMDYLAFDILKRLGVKISDDRRDARRQAIAFFEKIASGEMSVEDYGENAETNKPRISIGVKPPVL
jgi:phage gp36-like protein